MTVKDVDTGLLDSEYFLDFLSKEVGNASMHGEPYSVIVCYPQRFSDEHLIEVVQAAAACVRELLRDEDVVGRLAEDVIAIGLPNTAPDGARVLTYRLKGDLAIKTSHLRTSVWEAGYACLPDDGLTGTELLEVAYDGAKHGRDARVPGSELPPIPLGFD
ncbi:MAG: diguanylate cyclase [Dehalococcoidia bacterium]